MFTSQSSKSLTDLTTNSLSISTSPLSTTGLTEPRLQRSITAASNASTNVVAETGIIIVGGSPTLSTEVTSLVSTNSNLVTRSNDIVGLAYDPMFSPTFKINKDRWTTQERALNDELHYIINPTADDTFAGAYNLGNLNGKTAGRFSDISASDQIDYTRFHLDQTSSFNLLLKGAVGNVAVDLLNASGTTIASSDDGKWFRLVQGIATTQNFDTHDVALNLSSLAAGDYYLKVSPFWSQQGSGKGPLGRYYPPTTVPTGYDLTVSTEIVSNLLPTEVDLGTLSGVRLLKGSLDANNTSETYRVTVGAGNLHITLSGMNANADVRLIRDVNNDGIINENEAFAISRQGYDLTDGIYNAVRPVTDGIYNAVRGGTYFIQVSQGEGGYGAAINYNLGVSTGDWYTDNLSDYGVAAKARLAGADGWIDRNEMISILRDTEDGHVIDVRELADLKTVLSGLGHAMPESVRNLANKVLNGDRANIMSNIGNLDDFEEGNLFGGPSPYKMERLIGKWFLGNDRPVADTNTTYQRANGSLFQNGISWADVDQGGAGDCHFMAALAAVARTDNTIIENMITDNGDDTFTVRFFNNGNADYVTVDRFLPTKGNMFFYGNNSSGKRFDNNTNELWNALIEKAYAQMNESGWIGQDGDNSYASISGGGHGSVGLSQITGRGNQGNRSVSSGTWLWRKDDIGYIINAFNENKPVVFETSSDVNDSRLVPTHVYTLLNYNAENGMFTLFNPWGINGAIKDGQFKPGTVSLSKEQLINSFDLWSTTV